MKYRKAQGRVALAVTIFVTALSFTITSFGKVDDLTETDKLVIQQQIMDRVRKAYVDTTVNISTLMDGVIEGMMGQLDPHSSFMPTETASAFDEKIKGNFEGIGISFAMINDKITVIQVVDGGPSQAAGLKSRDKIVRIEGMDVVGIDQDRVKELLRGEAKTKVAVHVERPGNPDLLEFVITRDKINVNSVSQAFMLDKTTGYIKVTKFTLQTHYDVNEAMAKLKERGMERIVLDLRNNSGGSLDAAYRLVDSFLGEKGLLVVETRGKRRVDNARLTTTGEGMYHDIPMIVLINHGSASASEIVAGAFQDHDRALIAGQTSFGKGLVMNPFKVRNKGKDLGTLVLSTAHYYTPSGRLIQRPYDNGRDQYIKEGYDDVDPNAADSVKADVPVFYTDLGREVYGGGGITPDKTLEPLRRLNRLESSLRSTNIFFEFADAYLLRHDDLPETFDDYLQDYDIQANELDRFRKFILDKGMTVDNKTPFRDELEKLVKKYDLDPEAADIIEKSLADENIDLDESLYEKSVSFIRRELKGEIARMIWGDEERFIVWQQSDTELHEALDYFDEARDLFDRRLALGKEAHENSPEN